MAYFPMFMNMKNLKVLVVGAGTIATEKLEKLINFTQDITVIAQRVDRDAGELIKKHKLLLYQKTYNLGDIEGFDVVIVATQTVYLHKMIYEETRGTRVLVNSVDNIAYCDFIFPSFIKEDDLTIAFSTGGASPAFAKHIRVYFEALIPQGVGKFLKEMKILRNTIPKGKKRMKYFEAIVGEYFRNNFK